MELPPELWIKIGKWCSIDDRFALCKAFGWDPRTLVSKIRLNLPPIQVPKFISAEESPYEVEEVAVMFSDNFGIQFLFGQIGLLQVRQKGELFVQKRTGWYRYHRGSCSNYEQVNQTPADLAQYMRNCVLSNAVGIRVYSFSIFSQ